MLILLQTFLDIALLRRGPEHLPSSPVLLVFAAAFWLSSMLMTWVLLDDFTGTSVIQATMSNVLSLVLYGLFLAARGRSVRLTQTLTAILGATAYIAYLLTAWLVLLQPRGSALLLSILIVWAWTVQVEGRIISRAADISLGGGIAIAAFVLVVQLLFHDFLTALQQATPA